MCLARSFARPSACHVQQTIMLAGIHEYGDGALGHQKIGELFDEIPIEFQRCAASVARPMRPRLWRPIYRYPVRQ